MRSQQVLIEFSMISQKNLYSDILYDRYDIYYSEKIDKRLRNE